MMRIIEGNGLFSRRSDGTWQQHVGTGDTPTFTSPQSFSRWLHKRYRERDGAALARMVNARNWGQL